MRPLLLALALALGLAGCGSSESGQPASAPQAEPPSTVSGGASTGAPTEAPSPSAPARAATDAEQPPVEVAETVVVWVTRDAGAELLQSAEVDPGLTAIQAVDSAAEIETSYGGRYVSEIEGISSDLDGQHDWFFLINGIEPDVGGAEVKVQAGDVVWWDHRSWRENAAHPAAVVGAFPRPFHRGWKGAVRPVEVVAAAGLEQIAAELEDFLTPQEPDDPEADPHRFELVVDASVEGAELSASMGLRNGSPVTFELRGSESAVEEAARALVETPDIVARRYDAAFDDEGSVIEP